MPQQGTGKHPGECNTGMRGDGAGKVFLDSPPEETDRKRRKGYSNCSTPNCVISVIPQAYLVQLGAERLRRRIPRVFTHAALSRIHCPVSHRYYSWDVFPDMFRAYISALYQLWKRFYELRKIDHKSAGGAEHRFLHRPKRRSFHG